LLPPPDNNKTEAVAPSVIAHYIFWGTGVSNAPFDEWQSTTCVPESELVTK